MSDYVVVTLPEVPNQVKFHCCKLIKTTLVQQVGQYAPSVQVRPVLDYQHGSLVTLASSTAGEVAGWLCRKFNADAALAMSLQIQELSTDHQQARIWLALSDGHTYHTAVHSTWQSRRAIEPFLSSKMSFHDYLASNFSSEAELMATLQGLLETAVTDFVTQITLIDRAA